MTGPAPGLDLVERWQRRLASRVGMGPAEREGLRERLLAWCDRHAVTPDLLVKTWLDYPQLTVRRRPGASEVADLAVESFLIHSGVNVFGDIVCVAGRPEDLAQQGRQFVPAVD